MKDIETTLKKTNGEAGGTVAPVGAAGRGLFPSLAYAGKRIALSWEYYLMILPVLAFFIIFCYWPMYGVQIAFKDFWPSLGIEGSKWVGFKHFIKFFNSPFFPRLIKNTLGINVYSLLVGFPAPIILALSMNEVRSRRFMKAVQNISYAPYFISQVVMVGMILMFLSTTGPMNKLLALFGAEPVAFMAEPGYFWHLFVWTGVWQGVGFGTVIYMAVLSSIDPQLIEAAIIDGANKWRCIWHINIPALIPTAIILFILSAGGIMNVGFEKIYLMQNTLNMDASDVMATYIYRMGLLNAQFSYSAAVGFFNSVVNCLLLILVNQIARRGEISLW